MTPDWVRLTRLASTVAPLVEDESTRMLLWVRELHGGVKHGDTS